MPRRGPATPLALLGLCVLGFLLRTSNAATVFVGDHVVFAENDPYYHMRRVLRILADFPHVPLFDPWIDFPHGATIVFAPLFDLFVATSARLAGFGATDRAAVETLAALLPPLLGALTCLPVYAVAARVSSRTTGLLAAAIVALLPAHIWYSRAGFVDHHVAATLLQVGLCALVLRALDVRPGGRVAGEPPSTADVLLATAVMTAGLLTWNGFLLLVAIVDGGLAALFATGTAAGRVRIARLAALMHLAASVLVLPAAAATVRAGGAAVSSVTLSYLHVGVLLGAGVVSAVTALVAAGRWTRVRAAAVVAALAVAAAAATWPERGAFVRVLDWTLAADPFMSSVQESVSILRGPDGGLDLVGPQVWMSRFFLAAPLVLGLLGVRLARSGFADAGRTFVLVWSAALFILTVRQRRFGETLAPALAVVTADFLRDLARSLHGRLAARGLPETVSRAAGILVVLGLVVLAFAPYYRGFAAQPERLVALARMLAGEPSAADRAEQEGSSDVRLHRALRSFAELARRADAPGPAAPYGVMNPWPLGHKLLYLAEVPVTTTPFGSYVGGTSFDDWVSFFLASDEASALGLLEARRSRFVVVDNDLGTIGAAIVGRGEDPRAYYGKQAVPGGVTYTFEAPLVRTLYFRLTRLAGSEARLERPDGSTETVPALVHLRLVLDSANDDEPGFPKVYEVVRGATVVLYGRPDADVRLRYTYDGVAGRRRVHEKSVRLDAAGVARVVLPYSSERPDLGQTAAWTIESLGSTREIRVAEADVREGRVLEVRLP